MTLLDVLSTMGTLGFPSVLAVLTFFYRRAFKKQLQFSPALAFAYSYFNNYIVPLHALLAAGEPLHVDGHRVDKVFIRIPSSLFEASNQHIETLKNECQQRGHPLDEVALTTPSGKRTIFVKTVHNGEGQKILFDIPRILATTEQIINDTLDGSWETKKKKWMKMETLEIANFANHLSVLIQKHRFENRIKLFEANIEALSIDDDLIAQKGSKPSWLRKLLDFFDA